METTASSVGLRVNKDKSKIMKAMTDCLQTVCFTTVPLDEVKEFKYLRSVASTTGGTEQDIEARLGKARTLQGDG